MLTNKLSVAIADKVIVLSKLKEAEEAHGAVEGGRVNCAVHVGDALGDITAMRAENESLRSMVHMFHHLNPKAVSSWSVHRRGHRAALWVEAQRLQEAHATSLRGPRRADRAREDRHGHLSGYGFVSCARCFGVRMGRCRVRLAAVWLRPALPLCY